MFGVGFQEKIEGINDGHLRHQIHFDGKFPGLFGEHGARQVISLGVLLPIQEMRARFDFE